MQPRSYEHQLQVQKLQSPESIYTLESSIGTSFTLKTTFEQAPDTWHIFRAFNAYPRKHSLIVGNDSVWEVENSLITTCVEKTKSTRILPTIPCDLTASVFALAVGVGTFKAMSYAFPKCNIVDKTYWPCAATVVAGYLGYAYLDVIYPGQKLSGEGKLKHIVSKSLALDSRAR